MSSKNLRLAIPIAAALFVVAGIYGVATANFAPASPAAPAAIQENGVPTGAVMFFNLPECPSGWTELAAAEGRYLVGLNAPENLGETVGVELAGLEDRPTGRHTHQVLESPHSHALADPGHGHVATASTETAMDDIWQDDHYHNTAASDDVGYGDYIDSTDLDDDHANRPLRTSGALDEGQHPKIPEIHWREGPDGSGHSHAVSISTNSSGISLSASATGIGIEYEGYVDHTNAPYIQLLVCVKVEE